ncbi:MAG: tetratricopeptide repeat protein [Myxococcaceae bacterium]
MDSVKVRRNPAVELAAEAIGHTPDTLEAYLREQVSALPEGASRNAAQGVVAGIFGRMHSLLAHQNAPEQGVVALKTLASKTTAAAVEIARDHDAFSTELACIAAALDRAVLPLPSPLRQWISACVAEAVQASPLSNRGEFTHVMTEAARIYASIGDVNTAKATLQDAATGARNLRRGWRRAGAMIPIAEVFATLKDGPAARAALEVVKVTLTERPTSLGNRAEFSTKMADVHALLGDNSDAKAALEEAAQHLPEEAGKRLWEIVKIARVYARLGDAGSARAALQEAKTALQRMKGVLQTRSSLWCAIAQSHVMLKEADFARSALREAARVAERTGWERPRLLVEIARVQLALGDVSDAGATLQAASHAVERPGYYREPRLREIGQLYASLGDVSRANDTVAKLDESDSDNLTAIVQIRATLGDVAEARVILEKAAALTPEQEQIVPELRARRLINIASAGAEVLKSSAPPIEIYR